MRRLESKRVIITGAGSGIGRASARLFASEGAKVMAVDIDGAAVEATAASIREAGGTVIAFAADAGSETDVAAFVARCAESYGGIDVLFANAGIAGPLVPLAGLTLEVWQAVLRVNLLGPFLAAKAVAPYMLGQRTGAIVCTASVAGLRANAGPIPYSASKAAVISLVQTLANEFYGTGIRVNAICPGLVETGITRPLFEQARARGSEARIGQLNPLTRAGTPEEIARVALFLASDEAAYITGQAIAADGGLSSTLPFAPSRRGY